MDFAWGQFYARTVALHGGAEVTIAADRLLGDPCPDVPGPAISLFATLGRPPRRTPATLCL